MSTGVVMSFFRRSLQWEHAIVRAAQPSDRAAAIAFLNQADRRLLSSTTEEAADLLLRDPSLLLEADAKILGLVSIGWRTPPVSWLRTLAVDSRIMVDAAMMRLLPPLYLQLQRAGTTVVAVTVDDWSLSWLYGPLERLGYQQMVDVIGYHKLRMNTPDPGNQSVQVRRARPADLPTVLQLDAACFPLPWIKGEEILGPAIHASPCFLVAELNNELVGYAFATVHQNGRLVHLVRIAVDPSLQGQAIGVRLLSEVVQYCATHGTVLLSLNTQADNYRAQRLYEWFGFSRSDERQRVFGLDLPRD
jgi:[ribosomal protein S18]-alanine N-acetyltransferase